MGVMNRLLVVVIVALAPAWGWASEKITLTTGDWRPYLVQEESHHGVIARIVSEAFALEGIQVAYQFVSWTRAYADAEQGRADGSIIWLEEPERARKFYYSDPVFEARTVLFHLKGVKFDWTGIDDLYPLTVGGTVGYKYQFEPNPHIKVDRGATDEVGFRKLLGGRFTVFISDLNAGKAILRSHFSNSDVQRVTYHARPLKMTSYHLILPKKLARSPQLLGRFNRGLKQLRESGKYARYFADLDATSAL
jgi:polar amino acid transport system substrate-binding protein